MAGSKVAKEQRTGKIFPVHFITSTGTTVLTLNAGTRWTSLASSAGRFST